MKLGSILYALACIGIAALFTTATMRSYSPFADGGARAFVYGARGPTHK